MTALTLFSGLCFMLGGLLIGWVIIGRRWPGAWAGYAVLSSRLVIIGGMFWIVGLGLSLTHSIMTLALILPP